jgi:peroxiredoxin
MALALPLAADEEEGIKLGDRFEDFELPDVHGKILNTKALRKDKVLVLEFTTSWCKNCTEQLDQMQTLAAKVDRKKVQIVEVNVLSPLSHVRIELREQKRKYGYPVLLDFYKKVGKRFYVKDVPAIMIVDTEGVIRFGDYQPTWKEMKKEIDKCLKRKR